MKPNDGEIKKFKQEPVYPHLRSEGMTSRHNGGTRGLENHWSSWTSEIGEFSCPCWRAMQLDPECPEHGRDEFRNVVKDGWGDASVSAG